MKQVYGKAKTWIRNGLIAYAIIGTLYMMDETITKDLTGHYSADVYAGKIKPTNLEKKLFNLIGKLPLFEIKDRE